MADQYVSSVGYAAVGQWAALAVLAANSIVRQLAVPTDANARCFQTATGGTTGAAEPAWVLTAGSTSPTDGTITDWKEVTGKAALALTAPHSRIQNSLVAGWAGAGDTSWVADNHSYIAGANYTVLPLGTSASPSKIICFDHTTGNNPPLTADLRTGAVDGAGAFAYVFGNGTGVVYGYGVTSKSGSGSTVANNAISPIYGCFENWTFQNANTSGSGVTKFGIANSAGGAIELINPTWNNSATSNSFSFTGGNFHSRGGSLTGSVPTTLFGAGGSQLPTYFIMEGFDASIMGSGKNLCAGFAPAVNAQLLNWKLGTSVGVMSSAPTAMHNARIDLISSDSTTNASRCERYTYEGTLTTETTIVATGGATDGTTPYSWKVVTNANPEPYFGYFETFELAELNVISGSFSNSSMTATVEIVNDGTTLQNIEIWLEAQYINGASVPLCILASSGPADILAAGSNIATSTAAWTTTGITTPVTQKMQVTFTPAMNGIIRFVVKVAKVSKTIWIDPKVTLT